LDPRSRGVLVSTDHRLRETTMKPPSTCIRLMAKIIRTIIEHSTCIVDRSSKCPAS